MPPLHSNTVAILDRLQTIAQAYTEKRPGAREQLLNLSYALTASLELPSEAIQRMGWAEPARTAHCRIAVDLKLFDHVKASGETGTGAQELAARVGADEVLISRVMKHLTAMHVFREKGSDSYIATPLSNAFTEPNFRDGIIHTYDVLGPSFRDLPSYLKSTSYRNPRDLADGPFQYAHKTQLPFFAWIDQNPPYLSVFNNFMSVYRAGKLPWVDPSFYPISDRLINGFDSSFSDVFLVDVGGGLGHDLKELKTNVANLPGKLILQDREQVITGLWPAVSENIFEAMAHDFFTPQPVQNARAYYLHSVLHDWNDIDCIEILQQLKSAMKQGYSRLLVNEITMPGQDANWPVTAMDQAMMAFGAMQERTESQWRDILEKAGFKVTCTRSVEMATETLIEAELA